MFRKIITIIVTILVTSSLFALPPGVTEINHTNQEPLYVIDNTSLLNANVVTMFVTNHGNFGRDISGYFGYDFGTWFPVTDTSDIRTNNQNTAEHSPLYCGGIWIGGKVLGETRVSISEYSSEFAPGPMVNGTFQPDNPNFRNFKLYSDSLESNPNQDYLDYLQYAVAQGAPVDEQGHPVMNGTQMIWSVYNDADPNQHTNFNSNPLGVEIQQTIYQFPHSQIDTIIVPSDQLDVTNEDPLSTTVSVNLVEPSQFTGHTYKLIILDTSNIAADTAYIDPINYPDSFIVIPINYAWNLIDETTGETKLEYQTSFTGVDGPIVDGYQINVNGIPGAYHNFSSFECVANGAGLLDPPEAAAAYWCRFPVPTEADPDGNVTDNQQVGDGIWLFHTADNGGTNDGGTNLYYPAFLDRVFRGNELPNLGFNDFEMRFTGSYDNPGVGGSYAICPFNDYEPVIWVPFELWRIGSDTPDDPSDDVRLTPWVYDSDDNGTFNLSNWGDSEYGNGGYEHSVSASNDDPYTDLVYWIIPADSTPGESGYNADVSLLDLTNMNSGNYGYDGKEIMARTVLVNLNGGSAPPFNQDLPELGTVFRINSLKGLTPDTFYFTQTYEVDFSTNPEGSSVYIKYKLYNKGSNNIEDMFISIWTDPDLGNAADDLIGCDTLSDIFFCYNSSYFDNQYGSDPPAIGFKLLAGPVIPGSPSDTALFDNTLIPGYTNMKMSAFSMYQNGTDPDESSHAYNYMQGLQRGGDPYIYQGTPVSYMLSGNPIGAIGDVDFYPADKRMMASAGPINMHPGDSQFIFVKMAVAYGESYISAIDVVKEILNAPVSENPASLQAVISPNPQYIFYKHSIEPLTGSVAFGYSDEGYPGKLIDFSTFTINGTVPIDSVKSNVNIPGFGTHAATLFYDVKAFLNTYGQFTETAEYDYTLNGQYIDDSPLEFTGTVNLRGHILGDFNLDNNLDIVDLVLWVEYAFMNGSPPAQPMVLDMNEDNSIDITDLMLLVELMFG